MPAQHHAHHHKDEVIATPPIAIITRFFGGAIAMRLLHNLYYLYLAETLMARPQLFNLGRAATTGGGDPSAAAPPPERCACLAFGWDACEALRLPDWAVGSVFLVFWAAFLATVAAAFLAFS
jgi:hypothetical protein